MHVHFAPTHHIRPENCPIVGQFSEPPIEQMNASFSRTCSDHLNKPYNPGLRNNSNM
jgi:hypothetical protein